MKRWWWTGLVVTGIGTAALTYFSVVLELVGDRRAAASLGAIATLCGCGLLFFLFMVLTSKKED